MRRLPGGRPTTTTMKDTREFMIYDLRFTIGRRRMGKRCAGWCFSFLLAASGVWAGDKSAEVTLAETPAAVQKAIAVQVGDSKVESIERYPEGGERLFEVDFTTKAGAERDVTVSDDGTVVKLGLTVDETPPAVHAAIKALVQGWEIEGINKDVADSEIVYEVTVTKEGREKSFCVNVNGVLSRREISLAEAPGPVQSTVKAQIAGCTLQSIDEDIDSDGNSFDVEALAGDGSRKTFSVAPDGRLLSEGVTLEQVPPAVRKTIAEKIGDGRILAIDKSLFEKRGNVLPYQVQGRKSGRPFNFSVGPRGRFLGMDE